MGVLVNHLSYMTLNQKHQLNNMKIWFFDKKYKLSKLQSEALKIAILDGVKNAEYEQAQFEMTDKEYQVLQNKITALNDLAKQFNLIHE